MKWPLSMYLLLVLACSSSPRPDTAGSDKEKVAVANQVAKSPPKLLMAPASKEEQALVARFENPYAETSPVFELTGDGHLRAPRLAFVVSLCGGITANSAPGYKILSRSRLRTMVCVWTDGHRDGKIDTIKMHYSRSETRADFISVSDSLFAGGFDNWRIESPVVRVHGDVFRAEWVKLATTSIEDARYVWLAIKPPQRDTLVYLDKDLDGRFVPRDH